MAELTPELIADMALPRDLHLSPDGGRVAYGRIHYGKRGDHSASALWVAPTDGSGPPRQFTAGSAADRLPRWSPDGRQIAFLSDRARRGVSQLYLIDADGGEARPLTGADLKCPVLAFAWSPDGRHLAFTSADEPTEEDERRARERDDPTVYGERWPFARLRLLALATGEVTTLVGGDRHISSLAWSPDGAELAYTVWQTPALESMGRSIKIERLALAVGTPQPVASFACALDDLCWASDGRTLLFLASVAMRAQSSHAIWSVPAAGGVPRRIALGEESCASALQQPPGAPRAAVMIGAGLETQICWLDPATGALEQVYPAAGDGAADLVSWALQPVGRDTVLAVARGAGCQPWEVWAGRAAQPEARPRLRAASAHQTDLAGLRFGPQEPFAWTAPDGWELGGLVVYPPGAPAGQPQPTVVLVHGGPYARWGAGFNLSPHNWAQWLALAGYVVLMPNPRGSSGRGERFAAAAYESVGEADYGDVIAMVDAAVARGIADPQRLGIGGWSQGGFMAAWAVTQTDRFKAAIMGAGVSDWGMLVLTSDVPDFERELGGGAPWDGLEQRQHDRLSPITFARAVKTPVLILHGEQDQRVPVSQATGFHRALRVVGVPTELVTYPREPHGIAERAHQIDMLRRVRDWFDRWLRG